MKGAMLMTRENHHLWSCSLFQHRAAATAAGTTTILLVVMVWILALTNATLVQSGYVRNLVTTEEFDLPTRTDAEIFGIVRATAIAGAFPKLECKGHRYLGTKNHERHLKNGDGSPPGRLIRIRLRGEAAEDRAAIILSDADLSILAFENNQDTCYAFNGYEHLFPGSVVLNPGGLNPDGEEWDNSYANLLKGGIHNLVKVPLGKKAEMKAVRMLAIYRGNLTSEFNTCLLQNKVMFTEALRWRVIREHFSGERWETETYLTPQLVSYVDKNHWVQTSEFLYTWDRDGVWPGEDKSGELESETGISNGDQALDLTGLLRRPEKLRVGRPAN